MADVNPQVAPSSPATAVLEIPDVNSDAYAEWRATGELPEPPPPVKQKTEGSSPSKSEKSAPVSETGTHRQEPRERPRSNADDRLRELLADLKTAGLTPAELKSFKREAAKTEPPKVAPEQTVKPADEELKYPDINDFKELRLFQVAEQEYYKKLTAQEVKKAIEQERADRAREAGEREMFARLTEAKQRYGDGADKQIVETSRTIFNDQQVNPAVKAVINDSTVLADLMYVMGSKPEDLAEFLAEARTAPGKAIRRAVLVEKLVMEELAHNGRASSDERPRSDEGKVRKEAPVEKKPAEAPPPPRELGARTGPPGDEVSAATRANDFARYRDAANRRDVAARRGL